MSDDEQATAPAAPLPDAVDPLAATTADLERALRRQASPAKVPEQSPDAEAQALLRDPRLEAKEQDEARRRRRRRRILTGALLALLVLVIGLVVLGRTYRRGPRWVSRKTPVPALVQEAAGLHHRAALLLKNKPSTYHRALYTYNLRWLIGVLRRRPELQGNAPRLQNELAWFLLTTDDPEFHDPEEALTLAREAVTASQMKHAAIIDTYAEALYQNARFTEAIEAGQRALARAPDEAHYAKQLKKFEEKLQDTAETPGSEFSP
jgi:tetratricopeptide (TPR) repeat protein